MSRAADVEAVVLDVLDTFQYKHEALEFHDDASHDAIDLAAAIMSGLKAGGYITA